MSHHHHHNHHHSISFEENKINFIYCSLFLVFFSLFYQWTLYFRKKYILNIIAASLMFFLYADHISNFRIYVGSVTGVILALIVHVLFNKKDKEYSAEGRKWLFVLLYFIEPFALTQFRYKVIDHTDVYVGAWLWVMWLLLTWVIWKFVSPGKEKKRRLLFWSYIPLIVLSVCSGFLGAYDYIAFVIFIPLTVIIYLGYFYLFLKK